jgi:hypothetical protein
MKNKYLEPVFNFANNLTTQCRYSLYENFAYYLESPKIETPRH